MLHHVICTKHLRVCLCVSKSVRARFSRLLAVYKGGARKWGRRASNKVYVRLLFSGSPPKALAYCLTIKSHCLAYVFQGRKPYSSNAAVQQWTM